MTLFCKLLCLGTVLFILPAAAKAQGIPAAERPLSAQAGIGLSLTRSDYTFAYMKGFSAYGGVDFHQRFGLEADIHYDTLFTPDDVGEKTFMVGPRVILKRNEFNGRQDFTKLYVKALAGVGIFEFQKGIYPATTSSTYGAFAIGGGLDIHALPRVNVRAIDIEWQRWPRFGDHGLTPVVVTFGVAYRF